MERGSSAIWLLGVSPARRSRFPSSVFFLWPRVSGADPCLVWTSGDGIRSVCLPFAPMDASEPLPSFPSKAVRAHYLPSYTLSLGRAISLRGVFPTSLIEDMEDFPVDSWFVAKSLFPSLASFSSFLLVLPSLDDVLAPLVATGGDPSAPSSPLLWPKGSSASSLSSPTRFSTRSRPPLSGTKRRIGTSRALSTTLSSSTRSVPFHFLFRLVFCLTPLTRSDLPLPPGFRLAGLAPHHSNHLLLRHLRSHLPGLPRPRP